MIPQESWGRNCRIDQVLSKAVWDQVRRKCYIDAGYICEVCGGVGPMHPVECHEQWKFNLRSGTQELVGFKALCPDCHKVTHYGRSKAFGAEAFVFRRLQRLNKWSRASTRDYICEMFREHARRNPVSWCIDVSFAFDYIDEKKELEAVSKWLP